MRTPRTARCRSANSAQWSWHRPRQRISVPSPFDRHNRNPTVASSEPTHCVGAWSQAEQGEGRLAHPARATSPRCSKLGATACPRDVTGPPPAGEGHDARHCQCQPQPSVNAASIRRMSKCCRRTTTTPPLQHRPATVTPSTIHNRWPPTSRKSIGASPAHPMAVTAT